MNILHTSDWHLGRTLHGRRRQAEFVAFLDWLLDCLRAQQADVLVVAGDIFDTSTPGTAAQALYYRFLAQVGT
ncbi:MAG: exonuclease subunit SbcD, partial [Thiopseudomonas sp.]|nr:exonuclease subunit SbcD [Thiopseudomonas sp.]